ncbi:MAG: MarR family winged helix-turn-helix transcriptional regulator [Tumebacillaceae bacterium]
MTTNNIDTYIERIESAFHGSMQKLGHVIQAQMKSDLTGPQYYILKMLDLKGKVTASELANAMGVKPSAVTAMIDRLYRGGYVLRERDEKDRRVVFISISEQGRATYEQAEKNRKKVISHFFQYLEPEELETLVRLYEKLGTILSEHKFPALDEAECEEDKQ